MRVHYLSHVPFEKLGTMETWLEQRGARLSATRFYQGEPLPEPEQLDTLIVMGGPMGAVDKEYGKRFFEDAPPLRDRVSRNGRQRRLTPYERAAASAASIVSHSPSPSNA